MRYAIFFLIAFLGARLGLAQDNFEQGSRYSVAIRYTHEFVFDGYVRVREWELTGDKLRLKDLGVNRYAAWQIRAEKRFRKYGCISIVYDQYFVRGSATFDRDIFYNGTIIDGRSGIDVSPTRYFRLTGIYSGKLLQRNSKELSFRGGLVFDHIVFYLDGQVSPASPRNEVYERFGRQAFPYPLAGISGYFNAGDKGRILLEISGTYIPKFKSFYNEGGKVYLQYSSFLADVKYSRDISRFELGAGGRVRHMKIFQESREDTNELWILTGGPYIELSYHF